VLIAVGTMLLAGTTTAFAANPRASQSTGWRQAAELKGSGALAGYRFGESVAISGATAIVGSGQLFYPDAADRAYVFTKTATGWKQAAELNGSDTVAAEDEFGWSVAISGTTAVVSAPGFADAGRGYVFTKTATGWKQTAELKGLDTAAKSAFGYSVAISGSTLAVGDAAHAKGAGRAYVFAETGTGWKQTAELKGSDTAAGDQFGSSVAISGTTVVVGARLNTKGAGRAYVFKKTPTGWKQAAELKGSDTIAVDEFGGSVAISGTTVIVGAWSHSDGGAAYVFTKTASGWKQAAELKGSDAAGPEQFGGTVAISGTTIVVGACVDANCHGEAYIFNKTDVGWMQAAQLKGSDTAPSGDWFGESVGISGTTVVVGAPLHAKQAGRAYVFET
jgi:hypothetical protein